jgi:hypothetical protein
VKQIIAELIEGPHGAGVLRAVPTGTQLRQVYVVPEESIAWLDFSPELQSANGGSLQELLTVYAIVNSVGLNVPEVGRVGILIDGQPVESLAGHLDLSHPLPPDRSWLLEGGQGRPRDV